MVKAAASDSGAGAVGDGKKKKKTQGRQKIQNKLIQNPAARQVCFSKRRAGLFKKAFELSEKCGAQLALIVFSPAGKPYPYGNPSVSAVVDRFLNPSNYDAAAAAAAAQPVDLSALKLQEERLKKELDMERRRKEELDEAVRAAGVWIDADVQRWGMPELLAVLPALERVQAEAAERAHELFYAEQAMMQCGSTLQLLGNDSLMTGGDGRSLQFLGDHSLTTGGIGSTLQFLGKDSLAAGGAGSHGAAMDTTMTLMAGGKVDYALPTMMMPPPLHPQYFNHGFLYNNLSLGYGYNLGHGHGHGDAYETEGLYGTTCNLFR